MNQTQGITEIRTQTRNGVGVDSSLWELKQAKERWLEDGINSGILDNARMIAESMGKRIEQELLYPWNNRPAYRWKSERVTVELFTGLGNKYLSRQGENETREVLTIYVKSLTDGLTYQAARYTFTNNALADRSKDYFIPGQYILEIEANTKKAAMVAKSREARALESQRQELLKALLIGKDI